MEVDNKDTSGSFFVDSHTHLLDYDRQSHLQLLKVLQDCQKHKISHIVCNTCCSNEFEEMQKLYLAQAGSHVKIVPCFGIHPCYICEELKKQQKVKDEWLVKLKEYLVKYQNSHIGEIGLDFRKDVLQTNPQQKQWEYFEKQFQLAIQMRRSVTIHCVRAYGQLLKYFKKISSKYSKQQLMNIAIILHSYGGSVGITKSLLKLQKLPICFSLSLKHSKDILEVIPLQRVLLQTDAPYQNNHAMLVDNGLCTKQDLQMEHEKYQCKLLQKYQAKPLLKQCKFFNKSILDNSPKNVIANYRQVAKFYKMDESTFCIKIAENAIKALKLIK